MSPHLLLFAIISLITSARVQWHGIPVLWLIAAAVLILARSLLGDIRAGVIA